MTPHTDLEPSLLHLFRLFIGLRLVLVVFVVLRWFGQSGGLLPIIAGESVVVSCYLWVHLSSQRLRLWFGQTYLPFALVVTTLSILLEQRVLQLQFGMIEVGALTTILPDNRVMVQPPMILIATTAFLFVPLVLISWQYIFKTVLGFVIGITVIDLISLLVVADSVLVNSAEEAIAIIFRAMSFLIVGYIVSQLVEVKRRQNHALEVANHQLKQYAATQEQLAISRERNRLARELHDILAHTLSAVTVKLNAADLIWESDSGKARRMLGEVIALMDDSLDETRRALRDLRASPLEDMGLLLALERIATSAADRAGSALSLNLPNTLPEMSFAVEQGLYRIAQEALENTIKHADAGHIDMRLVVSHNRIMLTLRDDGHGFDLQAGYNGHFGLQGMIERAQMLGGDIDIQSTPGQGTRIHLRLELPS